MQPPGLAYAWMDAMPHGWDQGLSLCWNTYLVKEASSPALGVASVGWRHCFTARHQKEGLRRVHPPQTCPKGSHFKNLQGSVPWEKLQLPVWGSQGHWCSHWQGLWQPGPYQPRGHSVERRWWQVGLTLGGMISCYRTTWLLGVCMAMLKKMPPDPWRPTV